MFFHLTILLCYFKKQNVWKLLLFLSGYIFHLSLPYFLGISSRFPLKFTHTYTCTHRLCIQSYIVYSSLNCELPAGKKERKEIVKSFPILPLQSLEAFTHMATHINSYFNVVKGKKWALIATKVAEKSLHKAFIHRHAWPSGSPLLGSSPASFHTHTEPHL